MSEFSSSTLAGSVKNWKWLERLFYDESNDATRIWRKKCFVILYNLHSNFSQYYLALIFFFYSICIMNKYVWQQPAMMTKGKVETSSCFEVSFREALAAKKYKKNLLKLWALDSIINDNPL